MSGTLPRRRLSGLGGGLDTVGTTAVAVHHMLRSANGDIRPQRALEHLELGLAQRATGDCRVADGAVVLDEKEGVAVLAHLRQVPLIGTDVGQPAYALGNVGGSSQRARVAGRLSLRSGGDHSLQCIFTQCGAHGSDQIDGQLSVAIRKCCRSGRCQLPMHRWTTAAGWFLPRSRHHPRRLQCVEVLAQRGVGEPELGSEIGRGRRLDALQPLDDAVLRVGCVCHWANSTRERCISEGRPCIIRDARDAGRL
jgi:hypothetical protein